MWGIMHDVLATWLQVPALRHCPGAQAAGTSPGVLIPFSWSAIPFFTHAIPSLQDNATDIVQAVEWLRNNDKQALAMAVAARKFALEHLSRPARLCYWKTLLEEWSKLFRWVDNSVCVLTRARMHLRAC